MCLSSVSAHFLLHCSCYFKTHTPRTHPSAHFSHRVSIPLHLDSTLSGFMYTRISVVVVVVVVVPHTHMIHLHPSSSMYSYRATNAQFHCSIALLSILFRFCMASNVLISLHSFLLPCCHRTELMLLSACLPASLCVLWLQYQIGIFFKIFSVHHFIFSIVRQHLMIQYVRV